MRRRTQQPGINWPSDAGPGPRLGGVPATMATRSIHCLHSSELQTSVFVVHCTEGKRDVSMMLREGVEVERVEVLSDGGADGGGQR